MTISGISSYDYLSSLLGTTETDSNQTSTTSVASSAFGDTSDQANISSMGKIMSQLQQLSTSDPTKFKALAQQVSDDLSQEASSTTDSQQSKMLSQMSSNFAEAAQTGSMSSLKPKGPPPSGKGGGSGGDPMSDAESVISKDLDAYSLNNTLAASNAGSASNANAMDQLMRELSALQASDPTKFKELTQKISDDLADEADNTSDQGESNLLSRMSSDFATAAQTGSMSSLQPKGPPPPGGFTADSSATSGTSASASTGQDPLSILNSILSNDLTGLTSTLSSSASA